MGDGMNRVFELALGLANSKDGLLLVDELENGVHYSAQEQLWRLIFETASQLNVQVFATTHSWDCIESFQRAASAHQADGALISLARQDGDVKATVFNERDLEIITRESIEVR
jgi:AAA15 family ATPase/GTPase